MAFRSALIVDDSKLARVTLKKKLESHGLVVELADSAQQAYSALQALQPDIIFMDHLMPDIDGFEATQHIRQMAGFQQVPIVMCTGKEQDGYLEEALAIGASFILSKPPVDEALSAILAAPPALEATGIEAATLEEVTIAEHSPASAVDIGAEMIAQETDVADFMAESQELDTVEIHAEGPDIATIITPDIAPDITPMPETDIADFMAGEYAETMATNPVPIIPAQQEPAAIVQASLNIEEVERICAQMIDEALEKLPLPQPAEERPVITAPVDREQILADVNAAVENQLAAVTDTLKAGLKTDSQNGLEALVAEKIAQALDQDIQGLLDLRLNVMLAEKFADTNAKIESLEKQVSEKARVLHDSADMQSIDAPLTLVQPGSISARMEQLNDEQISLRNKLKVFQMVTAAAIVLAIAAIAVAFIR
jgi:two-component system, cell cycle response regulator